MLAAISPVWDVQRNLARDSGCDLFGAFPLVYSILLSAFYLPLLLMLIGLILRRSRSEVRLQDRPAFRPLRDAGFVIGSYAGGSSKERQVGAIVQGLAIDNGAYVGGPFDWASPLRCCGSDFV